MNKMKKAKAINIKVINKKTMEKIQLQIILK